MRAHLPSAAAPFSVHATPPLEIERRRSDLRIETSWARSQDDVRAAQRLRYEVFAEEMAARLEQFPGSPSGLDVDRFDAHCEHLLVRCRRASDGRSQVIGTYRVLTPQAASRAGGFYSESEFDLGLLSVLRPRMLELGRSCIHREWRTGGTILALWSALGEFMQRSGLDIAFGSASVSVRDGGHKAANLWHRVCSTRLSAPHRRVRPLHPLPLAPSIADRDLDIPPLIKGYLRCGAEFLGPPAWDVDFQTADFPMLMTLAGLPERHRRRFLDRVPVPAEAAENCAA